MDQYLVYNPPANEFGEAHLHKLDSEVNDRFESILSLLSSYFKSKVDGPSYARSLKIISRELATIKVKLLNIMEDKSFLNVRPEYLHQNVASLIFPDVRPEFGTSDLEYRTFLVDVVKLYLRGATKQTVKEGVELITGGYVIVEDFVGPGNVRNQFRFNINIYLESSSVAYKALTEKAVRVLVDILKPAHTIYSVKYIMSDSYTRPPVPVPGPNEVGECQFRMVGNFSEYFRYSQSGISGLDVLGRSTEHQKSITVII